MNRSLLNQFASPSENQVHVQGVCDGAVVCVCSGTWLQGVWGVGVWEHGEEDRVCHDVV